jgi:hypothetical protein
MVWWKSTDVSEEHIAPFSKVEEQAKEETNRRRMRTRVDRTKAWCFVDEENTSLRVMDTLPFVTLLITKYY